MKLPYAPGLFNLNDIARWAELHKPTQIEMTDGQYARFAEMSGMNVKTFRAIPIVFLDAPKIPYSRGPL